MRIRILQVGKTQKGFLTEGEQMYLNRLQHYSKVEVVTVPGIRSTRKMPTQQIQHQEGKQLLSKVEGSHWTVLLDEQGKQLSSMAFAHWLDVKSSQQMQPLTFIVGGAYGFSSEVYTAAQERLALSKMTFNHQMVRLFFYEQLYRAFTILKKASYHH